MEQALQRVVIDPLSGAGLHDASVALQAILRALDSEGRLAVLDGGRADTP